MQTKTGHDLKVWLTVNRLTQVQGAEMLGVTGKTMHNYCKDKALAKMVVLAVNGLKMGDL